MRASETIRHIQHIASLGLAPRVAVPLIVGAMHGLIPVNQIPFFWADSDGTITDFYGPDVMPSTLESAMTLNRYNTPDDVPTMDRLLNSARLINNTALLQQLAGWSNSAFLNDMLRGNNGENSMDFQLRDASGIRGAFAISRGLQDRAMSADEVRRVAALVPHILHAMNAQAGPEAHETIASQEIAHIISNMAGEVISCSANAANMILQLYDMPLGHGVRFSDYLDRLPPAAMLAVQRLRLIQNGETANPASIDLPTRWGLFRVSAVPMQAKPETISEMVIVTIQPLIDKRVKWAQNLVGTDLTPAERRVAMRMAGAGDGDAIARDLGIETSSYRQYAKRIYTALRVEGRMGVKAFLDR
jgi:hypothetical protein